MGIATHSGLRGGLADMLPDSYIASGLPLASRLEVFGTRPRRLGWLVSDPLIAMTLVSFIFPGPSLHVVSF